MKTLAFLLIASLILLLAGLFLRPEAVDAQNAVFTDEIKVASGSANIKSAVAPPEPRAKPVAEAKESPPTALLLALQSDALCAMVKEYYALPTSLLASRTETPGLLAAFGASADMQEAFAADGPLFGDPKQDVSKKGKLSRFLLALRLSGQLYGFDSSAPDLARAHALLTALEKDEAGNGAYPLYLLAIEKKLDRKPEQLRETARRAANASYFDSLLLAEFRLMEGAAWQSSSHHFLSRRIFNGSLINYAAIGTLQSLDEGSNDPLSPSFGRLLQQEASRSARGYYDLGFMVEEYSWGRTLAKDPPTDAWLVNAKEPRSSLWNNEPYVNASGEECPQEEYDNYLFELRSTT